MSIIIVCVYSHISDMVCESGKRKMREAYVNELATVVYLRVLVCYVTMCVCVCV